MKTWIRKGLLLILSLIIALNGACAKTPDKDTAFPEHELRQLAGPYLFNYVEWEFKTLYHELQQKNQGDKNSGTLDPADVIRFFSNSPDDQNQELKDEVENTLADQISQVLLENNINNPFVESDFVFPPVNFKLEDPPYLLIISPRDKIERLRDVTLKQDIVLSQVTNLESEIEALNLSAIVTPIGGLGATYPSFVEVNSDLKYTIQTAAEEWLHQYMAFKPLGFRYVLDLLKIKSNPDIDTLNETIVGIAAEELCDLVYARFYSQYPRELERHDETQGFDFDSAMRETRRTVDTYLACGQIEQAERYMEQRRLFINAHGYNIRKLNQAYFAFYSSYAYSPTSIDPLGDQVRQMRQQSFSLKDFLQKASGLSSRQELSKILGD